MPAATTEAALLPLGVLFGLSALGLALDDAGRQPDAVPGLACNCSPVRLSRLHRLWLGTNARLSDLLLGGENDLGRALIVDVGTLFLPIRVLGRRDCRQRRQLLNAATPGVDEDVESVALVEVNEACKWLVEDVIAAGPAAHNPAILLR